jgi:hypothetical protein
VPTDVRGWSKLGEIGCAISHWMCWQKAAADAADPALILEDPSPHYATAEGRGRK